MVPCVCVLCDPTCILFIHWVAWLFRQGHQTTSSSVAQLLVRTEKTREAPCTYGLMVLPLRISAAPRASPQAPRVNGSLDLTGPRGDAEALAGEGATGPGRGVLRLMSRPLGSLTRCQRPGVNSKCLSKPVSAPYGP